MNFKDIIFRTAFIIIIASLAGILFPNFVRYLFVIAFVVGVGLLAYWIKKNLKRE